MGYTLICTLQNVWQTISNEIEKSESSNTNTRRQPFKTIQPMAVAIKENAKLQKKNPSPNKDKLSSCGVIDRIEIMLEQGKYRPEGRTKLPENCGYRVRRKGQPTIFVRF